MPFSNVAHATVLRQLRRLELSKGANAEIEQLAEYLSGGDEDAVVRKFVQALIAHCQRLADLPGTLGTDRSALVPGLRSTSHKGYVIFFRYTADAVEIVSVLNARRDVGAYFATQDSDD